MFVQLILDITFHAIECAVTTCLPQVRGKLSQMTFPYKVVINNHSVTIEGNPILFDRSQESTQNFGISQPS